MEIKLNTNKTSATSLTHIQVLSRVYIMLPEKVLWESVTNLYELMNLLIVKHAHKCTCSMLLSLIRMQDK